MTEFYELCKEAEDIDFETRCAILRGKSEELLPLPIALSPVKNAYRYPCTTLYKLLDGAATAKDLIS